MSTVTSSAAKPVTASKKKKSPSTCGAVVDACSGNSCTCAYIVRSFPRRPRRSHDDTPSPPLAVPGAREEHAQDHERQHAAEAHEAHHRGRVFASGGVVMKAQQQHLIDERTDLTIRGFHDGEAQIARRILDAVEVAR